MPAGSSGRIRVSLYDRFLCVWVEGRQVFAFYVDDDPGYGDLFSTSGFVTSVGQPPDLNLIYIPEANMRVEVCTIDAGKTGLIAMTDLIGNKRIYFRDTQDGGLKVFVARETVNTSGTAYDCACWTVLPVLIASSSSDGGN